MKHDVSGLWLTHTWEERCAYCISLLTYASVYHWDSNFHLTMPVETSQERNEKNVAVKLYRWNLLHKVQPMVSCSISQDGLDAYCWGQKWLEATTAILVFPACRLSQCLFAGISFSLALQIHTFIAGTCYFLLLLEELFLKNRIACLLQSVRKHLYVSIDLLSRLMISGCPTTWAFKLTLGALKQVKSPESSPAYLTHQSQNTWTQRKSWQGDNIIHVCSSLLCAPQKPATALTLLTSTWWLAVELRELS